MKILVVGAGAIGGYFGGRLLEKGEDVTFLVRERRQQQLLEHGLVIESANGNVILQPKTIVASDQSGNFDVILLSTKSYHLQVAIEDIRPFVGENTMILPLLNGMIHMDKLIEEFGEERVLGGLCFIESTLDDNGTVVQASPINDLVFGERNGQITERIIKLEKAFSGTKAKFRLSQKIYEDMWYKYFFITAFSGITSLMRAPIGTIRETDSGQETIHRLLKEIFSIMSKIEAPILENIVAIQLKRINELGYAMKSSMQRDMEKLLPIEADHLQGYLLLIANRENIDAPILETIYANLKVYEVNYQNL
jgi:2-dehydropantoate 2-reductase